MHFWNETFKVNRDEHRRRWVKCVCTLHVIIALCQIFRFEYIPIIIILCVPVLLIYYAVSPNITILCVPVLPIYFTVSPKYYNIIIKKKLKKRKLLYYQCHNYRGGKGIKVPTVPRWIITKCWRPHHLIIHFFRNNSD